MEPETILFGHAKRDVPFGCSFIVPFVRAFSLVQLFH
jgi:hypothetical protein